MKSFEANGLVAELIEMIRETCNITDPMPDHFSPDDPLIGPESALGLDSLDAVEIVVAVEKKYNIRIGAQDTTREIFRSLSTLARHITKELAATRQ